MNNNRNNNNRRRGRGNRQQQGGGNQNRIDSRARGNAPQMFDKYKKLAQDAAHNGDRVQAEYYLQFADHYFRVIADNKARMDEQRGGSSGRREERDFNSEDDGDEDDFDVLRQPQGRYSERSNDRQSDRPNDRQRQRPRREDRDDESRPQGEGERGYEGVEANQPEPTENPFVRPSRERARGRDFDAPREGGRDDGREGENRRGRGQRGNARAAGQSSPVDSGGEIDVAALPPSFSAASDSGEEEAAPKRKLPPRRRRTPAGEAGGDDETLKAVG